MAVPAAVFPSLDGQDEFLMLLRACCAFLYIAAKSTCLRQMLKAKHSTFILQQKSVLFARFDMTKVTVTSSHNDFTSEKFVFN